MTAVTTQPLGGTVMTNPKHAKAMPGKGRWYVHPATGEMTIINRAARASPAQSSQQASYWSPS